MTRQGSSDQGRTGFGDLYPQATLKWNSGVNNWMTYAEGDIPVGTYNRNSLANLGIGHGAVDGGVGYTYLDQKTGLEFSAVTGLTYNLANPSTNYQNGIDWHLDWGASQYLSRHFSIGLVGYFYDQITSDRGCAAQLCPFESRVISVRPQVTLLFYGGTHMTKNTEQKAAFVFTKEEAGPGETATVQLAVPIPRVPAADSDIVITLHRAGITPYA